MLERSVTGLGHYRNSQNWSEADEEHIYECNALLERFNSSDDEREAAPQAVQPPVPVLFVSREQLESHTDHLESEAGRYLPARKTAVGKFTMPLYAHPAEGVPAHELIDWDSAHKIAFQAAAAFRPSYFKGADFVAHNWVVEAIRTAHIDGQRHAVGLPAIDRSAAFAADLRKERAATQPAAQGMLDAMTNAFITSESDGAAGSYKLVAKFQTLPELQAAHNALVTALAAQAKQGEQANG